MWRSITEIYLLLTPRQRHKLLRLQILVVLMSFAEVAGVMSIGPFMALVADMNQLQGQGWLAEFYAESGAISPPAFLFWLGVGVLIVLTFAALISMFTTWRLTVYGSVVGAELGNRLFRHYLQQPWLFHAGESSSHLTKQIAQECGRLTVNVITPLLQMNAKLVMAILMALAVFFYNPVVALAGIGIFSSIYLFLYKTVRRRLMANGEEITKAQVLRFKMMSEGFGGIKDVLLLGRQKTFRDRFDSASMRVANARAATQVMSQIPRYAVELAAFGSVIFLILYLLSKEHGDSSTILPIMSVYALAGFKLLPAFQQIYASVSTIRGNVASFHALRSDLVASGQHDDRSEDGVDVDNNHLKPLHKINLQNIVFHYPGKFQPALDGLTLEIPVNQVIGLVGPSGSGKSTAIDLLLGLIEPDSGQLLIDGQPLGENNKRAWQNTVGYVPQSIFLSDASIRENIAFGLPPDQINESRVKRAASMAHLDGLIEDLPDGIDTRVGERGVQLSGGQRQRIGIARALYHDADVLVLDEATSALDGITEKLIMDAIHDFSGKKTIIMIAHRLSTVKKCDRIYLMRGGQVVAQGAYDDLVMNNDIFRQMAHHAQS